MLTAKYTRTTVSVPENLFWEMKKRALIERKSIKEIITESLVSYLGIKAKTFPSGIDVLFGAWGKGIRGYDFLKKVRYGKKERIRENYLQKLWKKS